MTNEVIQICVVEDDIEFQEWILEEISSDKTIKCIGTFDVAEDALANIPSLRPDIVIMDLTLEKSDMGGIECMLRLRVVFPKIKLLVITSNVDDSFLFEALRVGAGAYIQKGDIPRNLAELILEFHEDGAPMSPGIAKRVIENFHKLPDDLIRLKSLSFRESQILELLSKGFLYKEVADKLSIAVGTVKQHTHKIYNKLQVNNCVEALRKYLNI